jgi:hypothetical protein
MSGSARGEPRVDQQVDLKLVVGPEGLIGHDRAERVRDHRCGLVLGDGVGHRAAHRVAAGRIAEVQVHFTW